MNDFARRENRKRFYEPAATIEEMAQANGKMTNEDATWYHALMHGFSAAELDRLRDLRYWMEGQQIEEIIR
jgi:hypothetical protein